MEIVTEKRNDQNQFCYRIFKTEMGEKLDYVNIKNLAQRTGLSYIRVWRVINGKHIIRADDMFIILAALNETTILNKIFEKSRQLISQPDLPLPSATKFIDSKTI